MKVAHTLKMAGQESRSLLFAALRELFARLASMSTSVAKRIADEAGGHPRFVDELVRHAQLHGGRAPKAMHLDDALVARVAELEPSRGSPSRREWPR